jgi:TRAP-type C4-dicarboxylate transport system permease small subunit
MMKIAHWAALWLAVIGGLLLTALMLMVVVSVSGRALLRFGLGPVPGDFELIEMGTAVVVFFFLPWCYLRNGHAMVDLVYMHLPASVQRGVTLFSDVLMLVAWIILTWRLGIAVQDKYEALETTFILQWPLWIAFALGFFGAVVGCFVYLAKTLSEFGLVRRLEEPPHLPASGHV